MSEGLEGFGKMLAWLVEGAPDRAVGVDAAKRLRIYVWKMENDLIESRKLSEKDHSPKEFWTRGQ